MNQEEMQSVFNFFGKQFSQYKFGIAVEESKIYFGTAHLPTTELKRLAGTEGSGLAISGFGKHRVYVRKRD